MISSAPAQLELDLTPTNREVYTTWFAIVLVMMMGQILIVVWFPPDSGLTFCRTSVRTNARVVV